MNVVVVESPLLEALVLDYGHVLQNLWALLALLTAALSFWKIRSASPPATPPPPPPTLLLEEECNSDHSDNTATSPPELELEAGSSGLDEIENDGEVVVVVETKGNKFMIKYHHHHHHHNDDEERLLMSDDGEYYKREQVVVAAAGSCCQWQWQMKMRTEMVEWHDRHLDMGMLDGNIVTLWDQYSY